MSFQEGHGDPQRTRRLDADYLDPIEAREKGATALQLAVVEARNDHGSWRAIARSLGVSVRTVREAWGEVNRRLRGGGADVRPMVERDEATEGNRELLRGIPVLGRDSGGGAIVGTRPGDPAWRAAADATLPPARKPRSGARTD